MDGTFQPAAPPGEAQDADVELGKTELGKDQRLPGFAMPGRWHPVYGIGLGLLLVISDARLYPGELGLSVANKLFFCIAVGLTAALVFRAWHDVRTLWVPMIAGAVTGIVVAAVSGDWFGGASEPPAWRDFIVPSFDALLLAAAAATWYTGRRKAGQMLLVAGVVATGMIFYGQQDPPAWALITAVAATLLFLAPGVGAFARITGLVVHALALLGLAQALPEWFTWTPFPFLSLIPVYLLALHARAPGGTRKTAWWSGIAVGIGLTLLGTSTMIGNMRIDAPIGDSLTMLGMGIAMVAAFGLLWWGGRRAVAAAAPVS